MGSDEAAAAEDCYQVNCKISRRKKKREFFRIFFRETFKKLKLLQSGHEEKS